MTPDAEAVLQFEIEQALKRYGIADFGNVGELRFGVWELRASVPVLIRQYLGREQAVLLVRRLQTEAILQLIKELSADARPAD